MTGKIAIYYSKILKNISSCFSGFCLTIVCMLFLNYEICSGDRLSPAFQEYGRKSVTAYTQIQV